MKNRGLLIAVFAVTLFAAALFVFNSLSSPPVLPEKITQSSASAEKDGSALFSEPMQESKPSVSSASGSAATQYEPVYPVNIGSETVREPALLHHNVPENLRIVYVQILNSLKEYKSDITLTCPENEDSFLRALIYVRDFNPDLFFIDWSVYNYKATNDKKVTEINFNFIDGNIPEKMAALENEVQKIVSQANRFPNLFERELFVHDYLVNNTVYSTDSADSGTAYGALVGHRARCEGYARAFQLIMLRLGVPCCSVIGTAENERHMWNAVDLYGEYYFVDVTFDDNSSEKNITSLSESEISHSCFNIPEEIISGTHSISPSGSTDKYGAYQNLFLPVCNSYEFNYYRIRGLMIENLEQFKYILEKNSSGKRACIFFRGAMPSPESFQQAFGEFFKNMYSSGSYSIYYTPSGSPVYRRNVFEINWENG